jgi:hypothetical protein
MKLYLREMGSRSLLSREGEIAIAKRMEAGREMMIGGLDHLDPEAGEGGHGVLDQVRAGLVRRQRRRDLGLGDVPAFPGARQKLVQCRCIRPGQCRVQCVLAIVYCDFH